MTKTKKQKPPKIPGDFLQFDIKRGLNKYGFIHIPTKARDFLEEIGIAVGVPLRAKINLDTKTLTVSRKAET